MVRRERAASNLELIGGQLCLDFANTVSTRVEALCREYLTTYGELAAWCRQAGIITEAEMEALLLRAYNQPELATAALHRAIRFRETIYRIFSALTANREPKRADLAALNETLREDLARSEVVRSGHGFEWGWVPEEDDLDWMLWPIVHSAADLLTSEDLERVQKCGREGCDWLFVDTSKNQSRRWCSMDLCGSRVKSRRYYQRKKSEKAAIAEHC